MPESLRRHALSRADRTFPGRFEHERSPAPCSTSFSCSSSLIRCRASSSYRGVAGPRALLDAIIDVRLAHLIRQRDRMHTETRGDLLQRRTVLAMKRNPDNVVTKLVLAAGHTARSTLHARLGSPRTVGPGGAH